MPDKRMRPIVKQEPGADGAQELQQQQAAAAGETQREGRRRRGDMGEEEAGTELEVQLLRVNTEAQAFALQGMERERAMAEELKAIGEQLLQSKAQVAELRADIRIKDAALEAKDTLHKAEVALLESKLQSEQAAVQCKDAVIEAKDALLRCLQSELQRKDDAPAAGGTAQQSSARAAAAAGMQQVSAATTLNSSFNATASQPPCATPQPQLQPLLFPAAPNPWCCLARMRACGIAASASHCTRAGSRASWPRPREHAICIARSWPSAHRARAGVGRPRACNKRACCAPPSPHLPLSATAPTCT
jgi:hypothetical protein